MGRCPSSVGWGSTPQRLGHTSRTRPMESSLAERPPTPQRTFKVVVGHESEIIMNTLEQTTTLPAKLEWKAVSDKKVASLKKNTLASNF